MVLSILVTIETIACVAQVHDWVRVGLVLRGCGVADAVVLEV